MVMSGTISILGCGYVGEPLAKLLLAHGWRVRGATTTQSKLSRLLAAGIEPYLLKLTPKLEGHGCRDFFDSEIMVINFPPGRKRKDVQIFMQAATNSLLTYLRDGAVQKVVFVSSTSVYSVGYVREEDAGKQPPDSLSGRALLAAEKQFRASSDFETTILRYGGLYGYQRRPGRFWSHRPLSNPANAVNMLHRDDAVGVTFTVITKGGWGEIFNVCADLHPTRKEFYTQAAQNLNIPPPHVSPGESKPDKIVVNDKVRIHLGYTFAYPDPLAIAP